jgi:hypothetical protein
MSVVVKRSVTVNYSISYRKPDGYTKHKDSRRNKRKKYFRFRNFKELTEAGMAHDGTALTVINAYYSDFNNPSNL